MPNHGTHHNLYCATSLGAWMRTVQQQDRTLYTTVALPWQRDTDTGRTPKGVARLDYKIDYRNRFGLDDRDMDTGRWRLRVGLVSDNYALYAFHPGWAKRLPILCAEPGIEESMNETLAVGASAITSLAHSSTPGQMADYYMGRNRQLDYWWEKDDLRTLDPLLAGVRYEEVNELRDESDGTQWRRFTSSSRASHLSADPSLSLVIPSPVDGSARGARSGMAKLADFPDEVWIPQAQLAVLASPWPALRQVYRFFLLEPGGPLVILERRANVIVALLMPHKRGLRPGSGWFVADLESKR